MARMVEESADELFDVAEKDIMNVDSLINKPKYPVDLMYNIICFHATQAVEKFLKGFIINNGRTVEKIHDLDILLKAALEIDPSFIEIMDCCLLLNKLLPNIKYSSRKTITNKDIDETIVSLDVICSFPPIKALRESFSKMHNYEIVTNAVEP